MTPKNVSFLMILFFLLIDRNNCDKLEGRNPSGVEFIVNNSDNSRARQLYRSFNISQKTLPVAKYVNSKRDYSRKWNDGLIKRFQRKNAWISFLTNEFGHNGTKHSPCKNLRKRPTQLSVADQKELISFKHPELLSDSTIYSDKLQEKKTKRQEKIAFNLSEVQESKSSTIKSYSGKGNKDIDRKKRSSNDEEEYLIEFRSLHDVYSFLHSILPPFYNMSAKDKNVTSEQERLCLATLELYYSQHEYDEEHYCNSSWDSVSCWPRTPVGTTATVPCPAYLADISRTNNATKYCEMNGTWAAKAVYDMCVIVNEEPYTEVSHVIAIRVIYNVGFTVSTLALMIALFIFVYFRSLRCLRNSIHCHLIVTFILKNMFWIIMRHTLIYIQHQDYSWICKTLTSMFNYLHATNFYWMFVEGLYLHVIIVWTYSADKIKLRYLIIIGWVLPSTTIIAWIVVRALYQNDQCWLPSPEGVMSYDFIYIGPILVVLCANIIFLSTIVWVLITKLRASHTLETRQYRKAVKATVILFPLLGITYVIFITSPSEEPKVKIVYTYINATLESFQGLLVAVFYCFLNGEVKAVLKKKLMRYNDARSLSTKYTRTSYGWTRGSRDYGNTVTLANGGLVDTNYRTSKQIRNCVTENIPLTDSVESQGPKEQAQET